MNEFRKNRCNKPGTVLKGSNTKKIPACYTFDIHVSVHHDIIYENGQQDATV